MMPTEPVLLEPAPDALESVPRTAEPSAPTPLNKINSYLRGRYVWAIVLSLMLAVLLWRFLLCRVFAVHRLVGELPLRLGRLEVGIGQQSVRLVLGAHNLTMVLPCIVNLVLCGLYGFNIRTGLEAGAIRSAVSAARGLE